ncbi:MAG: cytochrome c3 family protein [Pirellula sp.]
MPITGKQRAQRISRSYHGRPDPNIAWKRTLGVVGLVAALLYTGWLFSGLGNKQVSTGELSQAHFHLNENGCDQCHLPYQTIRFDSLWGTDKNVVQLNNKACNGACHKVSDHFASRTQTEVLARETCSRCHQEHLGKHRSLLDIADSDCSRCHSNLETSSTSPKERLVVASNFSTEHPKLSFEKYAEDPGTILFSHIQHMRPGQPKTPDDKTAKKLVDLPPEYRAKYEARANAQGLLQLRCSDCHERDVPVAGMDELELPNATLDASMQAIQSSSHMLYKAVDFEKHCIACHEMKEVPHGLNREQTEKAIRQRMPALSMENVKDNGKQGDKEADAKLIELSRERIDRLEVVVKHFSDDCKKCHILAPAGSADVVLPSAIPTRWMADAAFTHGKHLMVSCKECHVAAYQESNTAVDSVHEANQIMISGPNNIAGLDLCRKCHIQDAEQRTRAFAKEPHVASADCVDCHRYHVDRATLNAPLPTTEAPPANADAKADIEARIQWLQSVSSSR